MAPDLNDDVKIDHIKWNIRWHYPRWIFSNSRDSEWTSISKDKKWLTQVSHSAGMTLSHNMS